MQNLISLHDKLVESLHQHSCVFHDQAVVFVVGHRVPLQLNHLPQQGGVPPVCVCVCVHVCVCVYVCVCV